MVVNRSANVISKEKKRLVSNFGAQIKKVSGNDVQSALVKLVEWTVLVNAMSLEVCKHARKLTANEVEQTVRDAISIVTSSSASTLVSDDVLKTAVQLTLTLQNEAWKTRCWGICGGKKTVG